MRRLSSVWGKRGKESQQPGLRLNMLNLSRRTLYILNLVGAEEKMAAFRRGNVEDAAQPTAEMNMRSLPALAGITTAEEEIRTWLGRCVTKTSVPPVSSSISA
jgi:hypothetical protein